MFLSDKSKKNIQNGAVSGYFTVFLMQPLQVIRTNMMINYKDGKNVGLIHTYKTILKNEGFNGFYRGFLPALLKTTTGSAFYFGSLEYSKKYLKKLDKYLGTNAVNFICSWTAKTVQCILMNPLVVVKTRMEVVNNNSYKSFIEGLSLIRKEEGIKGYMAGMKAGLVKDVPSSATFYCCYEFVKSILYTFGFNNVQSQAFIASFLTNIIITFITNPLDVIRTRQQYLHLSKNENHNYKGIISGTIKIAKLEGIRGLCVGIVPRFMKRAMASVIVWTSYETLKVKRNKEK